MSKIDEEQATFQEILNSLDLRTLNERLTDSMKQQRIQPLIRGDNLQILTSRIANLAAQNPGEELFASAMLGRITAVARGRETEVYESVENLFTKEPNSIETLSDGDEKEYASKFLSSVKSGWVTNYCAREALAVDTANNARKELLRTLLSRSGDISTCLITLASHKGILSNIDQTNSRTKRVRRIFESIADVLRIYDGEVGDNPGKALSEAFFQILGHDAKDSDQDALFSSIEAAISILVRIIELRFSNALHSETYYLIQDGKKRLSSSLWSTFLATSNLIPKVQMDLLETALVLARQNRTDKEILRVMESSWGSVSQISSSLKNHFTSASDIDPSVAEYWLKVGRVTKSDRAAEHKLGNTEDQQIGELLIQLDSNRESMGKLNSAVVPVLKTFDPCQAATVERAANGYESIAQVAERLARMRRLSKTDILGTVIEYNPIEHDMEGGHRSGIRTVKVVRDGILKQFGGKIKVLVKPRVEPED